MGFEISLGALAVWGFGGRVLRRITYIQQMPVGWCLVGREPACVPPASWRSTRINR